MEWWVIVLIVIGVAAVVIGGLFWARDERRRRSLRERFGPEYDRTLAGATNRKEGEAELADRVKRREALDIRPLSPDARKRYGSRWQDTQARFVDGPQLAVGQAHDLLNQVMGERGYPIDDQFETDSDLVSVDHPAVVEHYRIAYGTYSLSKERDVSTEELRNALLSYRRLFDEMLEPDDVEIDLTADVVPDDARGGDPRFRGSTSEPVTEDA